MITRIVTEQDIHRLTNKSAWLTSPPPEYACSAIGNQHLWYAGKFYYSHNIIDWCRGELEAEFQKERYRNEWEQAPAKYSPSNCIYYSNTANGYGLKSAFGAIESTMGKEPTNPSPVIKDAFLPKNYATASLSGVTYPVTSFAINVNASFLKFDAETIKKMAAIYQKPAKPPKSTLDKLYDAACLIHDEYVAPRGLPFCDAIDRFKIIYGVGAESWRLNPDANDSERLRMAVAAMRCNPMGNTNEQSSKIAGEILEGIEKHFAEPPKESYTIHPNRDWLWICLWVGLVTGSLLVSDYWTMIHGWLRVVGEKLSHGVCDLAGILQLVYKSHPLWAGFTTGLASAVFLVFALTCISCIFCHESNPESK